MQEMVPNKLCEWRVRASPSSSLTDLKTGKEYPYLFWEATIPDDRVARSFNLSKTPSFCVPGDTTGARAVPESPAVVL